MTVLMDHGGLGPEYLRFIFEAATVCDVLDIMCAASFALGGDKFSYHPEVMFEGVASTGSEVYAVGYPKEWTDLYFEGGAKLIDPTPDAIMRLGRPTTWEDALKERKLTNAERQYLLRIRRYGMGSGYGFPLWGPNCQNAFVAVGFPEGTALPGRAAIDSHQMLLLGGHQKICFLTCSASSGVPTLSDREREVLTWIGRGKSNTDVACILGISAETVATYVRRIYEKLHCHDRIGAVIKALRMSLIRV